MFSVGGDARLFAFFQQLCALAGLGIPSPDPITIAVVINISVGSEAWVFPFFVDQSACFVTQFEDVESFGTVLVIAVSSISRPFDVGDRVGILRPYKFDDALRLGGLEGVDAQCFVFFTAVTPGIFCPDCRLALEVFCLEGDGEDLEWGRVVVCSCIDPGEFFSVGAKTWEDATDFGSFIDDCIECIGCVDMCDKDTCLVLATNNQAP